jgi:hypothetical protein
MTVKHALIAGLAAILLAGPAHPATASPTQALRVAVNKAEVVTLGETPAVALVANPKIADIVVEQGRLIFVIGKTAGETRLYVYGAGGRPLVERDVVVVPEADHAVTVIRDTISTDYSCAPRCVALGAVPSVGIPPAAATSAAPASPAGAAPAAAAPAAATVAAH